MKTEDNFVTTMKDAVPLRFFDRPTVTVARELIGCRLVVGRETTVRRFVITETEAYDGPEDLACHASKGRTKRTDVLFREPGTIYVYLCYGLHWLINFVTGPVGYPSAVLVRGIQTLDGRTKYNGPAKLTKALGITGEFNGRVLSRETGLWVEPRGALAGEPRIAATPRIGVDYAGPIWSKVHYRFVLQT